MTTLQVHFQPNSVVIYHKNQCIGTIDFHKNPYHHQHTYLKCHLKQYDTSLAPSVFQVIRQHTKQPLQLMLDSTDQTLITFLEAGGFRCLRKCYEMDISAQDYLGNPEPCDFQIAEQASSIYNRCCQLLLDYYKETHEAISPFTGSKEDFFKELPSTVYYHTAHNEIQSLAFIEDNEIAYLWGKSQEHLRSLANQIIPHLFQKHDQITFEADDVDPCAMTLKSLFTDRTNEHWDTYVLA